MTFTRRAIAAGSLRTMCAILGNCVSASHTLRALRNQLQLALFWDLGVCAGPMQVIIHSGKSTLQRRWCHHPIGTATCAAIELLLCRNGNEGWGTILRSSKI